LWWRFDSDPDHGSIPLSTIMMWSSNGATVWDDPTACAVAGSILSAHFSQIKTFFTFLLVRDPCQLWSTPR